MVCVIQDMMFGLGLCLSVSGWVMFDVWYCIIIYYTYYITIILLYYTILSFFLSSVLIPLSNLSSLPSIPPSLLFSSPLFLLFSSPHLPFPNIHSIIPFSPLQSSDLSPSFKVYLSVLTYGYLYSNHIFP